MGLATRVLTGLASAGMLPIAFAMAADRGDADTMKRIAWVQSGLTLGMISSPALGALLTEWLSWRSAFLVLGLASWLLAAGLLILRKEAATETVQETEQTDASHTSVWAIPGAVGALLAMCFGLGGGIGLFNLIGQHLRDTLGMSVWSVGTLYALLGVVSVIGNMLMPRIANRFESGRQIMRAALVVCLLVSVVFYLFPAEHLAVLVLPMVLWALAGGVGSPALQGYISGLSSTQCGMLISLAMTMMHIGVAIWSGIAGFAYSLGSGWMALLATALFGAGIMVLRPVAKR